MHIRDVFFFEFRSLGAEKYELLKKMFLFLVNGQENYNSNKTPVKDKLQKIALLTERKVS